MKVAGMKMTNPWASRVLRNRGVTCERVMGAPVETVVVMESVTFEHHGPGKNYRPLLHLTGELRSILPAESLPHGIDEITYRAGLGPTVDAFYEFDDVQLAELVSKGYFTEGFEPPSDRMSGIPWELPTTIDALILAPEDEADTPVVFVTIHGQTGLALDAKNSGYDLAGYFENQLGEEAENERATAVAKQETPALAGGITDIFAEEDFLAHDATRFAGPLTEPAEATGDFPTVRASIFDELMSEFKDVLPVTDARPAEAAVEAEIEAAPEPEAEADPMDSIYRDRIAPGVAKALSLGSEAEDPAVLDAVEADTVQSDDREPVMLDLSGEVEELTVAPIAVAPVTSPVWEPEAEDVPAGNGGSPTRRVQRTLAHERALEKEALADNDRAPELG